MTHPIQITHLTSAHPRYDIRIFVKMCGSLAKERHYKVNLVVADNQGNEEKNGVSIYDVGKLPGRINRIFKTTQNVFKKAKELDSDIYHLHDPELIPVGLKLKKLGKVVIFDAHEDLPKQLLGKPYLNKPLLTILSKTVAAYENYTCKKFDAIVAATPYIRDKFKAINPNSIDINNFPLLEEFSNIFSWQEKEDKICYIGGIAKVRGIQEIVHAMEYTQNVTLCLAGLFNDKKIEETVRSYAGWEKVNALGFLDREEIANVLRISKAGLVTLHPIINYQDALPVKMFEYMAAGLPVIASDIPLWKRIIEENKCGICVDPFNPKAIADAINYIVSHPKESEEMGVNGRRAVMKKYNWAQEEAKLYSLYRGLLT